MIYKTIVHIQLLSILLISGCHNIAFAQTNDPDVITNSQTSESTVLVNQNFLNLSNRVSNAINSFQLFSSYFLNGLLLTSHGGTNVDSSAWTSGDIVYMSGLGVWSHESPSSITPNWVPNNVQTFTVNGTWTKPVGVTKVYVKLWGAGGGGGDACVGGGCAGSSAGTNGGNSSFAGSVTITGGGGTGGLNGTGGTGNSGTGGTCTNADVAINGFAGISIGLGGFSYSFGSYNPVTTATATVVGQGGTGANTLGLGDGGGGGAYCEGIISVVGNVSVTVGSGGTAGSGGGSGAGMQNGANGLVEVYY